MFVARLMPGADLLFSLTRIVEKEGVKAAVIISGVGLLRQASLRNVKFLPEDFPITDENRSFKRFKKPLEILSISGNVSEVAGKPQVHAHVTLSSVEEEGISAVGGHLIEGCIVHGFAEVILMELGEIKMEKFYDDETKTFQLFSSQVCSKRDI